MDQQTASVTRSYTRKINCGAYGGKQYESMDFFESRSRAWFNEHPTEAEVDRVSNELFAACVASVEKQVSEFIARFETPTPKKSVGGVGAAIGGGIIPF